MWRLKSRHPTAFNEGLGNDARDLAIEKSGGSARGRAGRGRSWGDTQHRLAPETLLVHLQRDFRKFRLWQERCGVLASRATYCLGKRRREESCKHALVHRPKQVKKENTCCFEGCKVLLSFAFSSSSLSWPHLAVSTPSSNPLLGVFFLLGLLHTYRQKPSKKLKICRHGWNKTLDEIKCRLECIFSARIFSLKAYAVGNTFCCLNHMLIWGVLLTHAAVTWKHRNGLKTSNTVYRCFF